jgi:tripartite-type tricarboxylate transporter receptor subunit TctC
MKHKHYGIHLVVLLAFFIIGSMMAADVFAQASYPNKPIRIVTAEVAGGADFVARLIAQGVSGSLGQQVIVENRGGSAIIPAQAVAKAPPDGYTLLVYGNNFWLLPFIQNVPYDPVRDFSPLTLAARSPNMLVVHPSLPVKSVRELIALAKAKPGELNYASAATGGSSHLAAELFKALAGVNIVRVPYKGTVPGITDLIAGQVQLMFGTTGTLAPHVQSGRLRALAVTSVQETALAPGLPTVAAAGLPGYEAESAYGLFAPAGTPAPILRRLHAETVRVLSRPEVKERLFNTGVEVVGNTPEAFAASIKSDMARMGKVIKDAGIRAD